MNFFGQRKSMIKKIAVKDLKVGMYIHDLDCSWMRHPFLLNHFAIENESILHKLTSLNLKSIYIDTKKGSDLEDAPTLDEVQSEFKAKTCAIADKHQSLEKHVSIDEEIHNAKEVYKDTHRLVHNLLLEARLGRQMEFEALYPLVDRMTDSIMRNKDALQSLCRIKQKDEYTYMHSVSVAVLLMSFARAMGFSKDELKPIGLGGLLHDIGKMRVDSKILNKPGRLTDEEFNAMKKHVEYGVDIVGASNCNDEHVMQVIAQHHEHVDGHGYPHQLNEQSMSLIGKMASIVDVYDALTSDRVYKNAWEPTTTLQKFIEWSEHHFNLEMVHHFVRCVGIYPVGTLVLLSNDEIAVVVEQHNTNLLSPVVKVIMAANMKNKIAPYILDLTEKNGDIKIMEHIANKDIGINPLNYV